MQLQFTTRSLLLSMAFAGIWVGATLAIFRVGEAVTTEEWGFLEAKELLNLVIVASPFWLPFGFVGYVVGKKSLSVATVVALGLAEALAVGASAAMFVYM